MANDDDDDDDDKLCLQLVLLVRIAAIVIDAAYRYRRRSVVCVSVCMLDIFAEPGIRENERARVRQQPSQLLQQPAVRCQR